MWESKVTVNTLQEKKKLNRPITMLTAYDYPMAQLIDQAGVDCILVGDSLGNVILGYETTLQVTMSDMLHHVGAVARGVKRAMVIADMPFLSCHLSVQESIKNAGCFIQAGAHAVKVEGATQSILNSIAALIEAGIPVIGHLGLTPQKVLQLGGFKVQGKEAASAEHLLEKAKELEEIGVFAVVLECVPAELGKRVSESLSVPTIGIGAGPYCDGQVLVTYDLLGISEAPPKFVKKFADLRAVISQAVGTYIAEVTEYKFPGIKHSYVGNEDRLNKLY